MHPDTRSSQGTFLPPATALVVNPEEIQSLYGQQEFRIYQDAIEKLKSNEDQLPSLPAITLEIRKALGHPDVSHRSLANLIVHDPGLTAILMKHASSSLFRTSEKPKNLPEAIARLGMSTVDNLVLAHSLKSLFIMKDPNLKQLFKQALRRQTLKACISYHLAHHIKFATPDNALVASLLSEVGTLAMLVAMQKQEVPAEQTYRNLCRHYSKHLGAVLLAKWGMDRQFSDILRLTGEWKLRVGNSLHLADIINLALFHTIHQLHPDNDLPPLQELAAWQKISPPFNGLNAKGLLLAVEENRPAIAEMARSFT